MKQQARRLFARGIRNGENLVVSMIGGLVATQVYNLGMFVYNSYVREKAIQKAIELGGGLQEEIDEENRTKNVFDPEKVEFVEPFPGEEEEQIC